jgi:hypothetical protein
MIWVWLFGGLTSSVWQKWRDVIFHERGMFSLYANFPTFSRIFTGFKLCFANFLLVRPGCSMTDLFSEIVIYDLTYWYDLKPYPFRTISFAWDSIMKKPLGFISFQLLDAFPHRRCSHVCENERRYLIWISLTSFRISCKFLKIGYLSCRWIVRLVLSRRFHGSSRLKRD